MTKHTISDLHSFFLQLYNADIDFNDFNDYNADDDDGAEMKMGRLQLAPAPSTVPAPSAATVPALIHVFNDIPAPSPV